VPTVNGGPLGIAAGPDGNLWFTERNGNRIGRITPGGRITPSGAIVEFPVPTTGSILRGIAVGPDGNLWFVEEGVDKVGHVTLTGAITEFSVPTASSSFSGITAGPDGQVWFAESAGHKIARFPPVSLTISPASGALVTTQHFDLTLRIFPAGLGLTGGQVLFDGADVTPTVAACLVPGTRVAGGLTFRCPNLTGGFAPGVHTFSIRADFSDGSSARDTVLWQFDPNHEP
jgi:DNA-binding beta-propeller fold protein YncE